MPAATASHCESVRRSLFFAWWWRRQVLVRRGRVEGAMLIGDTDLEETFENLIMSRLDVTEQLDLILDPDVDIADYYD